MMPDCLSGAQPWPIPKLSRGADWHTDLFRVPNTGLFESIWPHRTLKNAEVLMHRDPNLRLAGGLSCNLGSRQSHGGSAQREGIQVASLYG
jgi:hypothetical protein